ncbi:uncharacterized protein LOC123563289 isoform X2 [Mercenaria mercenaria]|uniref:uncharacterized protein LOC123563289 isoform X2 n=1 Tax=Mercenaria mercenaria TaxID=6596 RepID=UPI00234F5BE7|nr:uncharacterized protein LOC123563289 isoform X2 [Mercenaria mercenaria]XP_053386728.1 uncharacterized protein LOC123563289 isoform X2 [Mercenaria mercenaria]
MKSLTKQHVVQNRSVDMSILHTRFQFLLVIFTVLVSLSLASSQALHLPAERFPCGVSGLTCERWGYTACVNPDGEFYCLSCDNEYLRTLCGTKEEAQGCNLYCTKKTVDVEKDKIRLEFSKENNDLKANFSGILMYLRSIYLKENTNSEDSETEDLADLQSDIARKLQDLQIELEISHNETNLQKSRVISLESGLTKKTSNIESLECKYSALLAALFALVGFLACTVAIALFCLCRRWHRRNQTREDIEKQEMSSLMVKDESDRRISQYSKESGIDLTIPAVQDDETQTENFNEVSRQQEEKVCDSKHDRCPGDSCPGYAKLQMIPPSDHNGSSKMAI